MLRYSWEQRFALGLAVWRAPNNSSGLLKSAYCCSSTAINARKKVAVRLFPLERSMTRPFILFRMHPIVVRWLRNSPRFWRMLILCLSGGVAILFGDLHLFPSPAHSCYACASVSGRYRFAVSLRQLRVIGCFLFHRSCVSRLLLHATGLHFSSRRSVRHRGHLCLSYGVGSYH